MTLALPASLVLSNIILVLASTCPNSPINLPVQHVPIANGQWARGVAFGIGNPIQNLSFAIDFPYNTTWVHNSSHPMCDSFTSAACITYRGGLYDPSLSSTASSSVNASGEESNPGDSSTVVGSSYVLDNVYLPDIVLTDFLLGMPDEDITGGIQPMNFIGLGANSTFISHLYSSGRILSRTFSYYWGLMGATAQYQTNGQLVLGGYDAAKVTGSNLTLPLQQPTSNCPTGILLEVTGMDLNFPNGTNANLLGSSSLTYCLEPDFIGVMTLSSTYFANFENLTGTSNIGRAYPSLNYGQMLYSPNSVYQGDLSVTFLNSLTIRVPNNQLVVPDFVIESDGGIFANTSVSEVLISDDDNINENDTPILGRQFLSSAYILVNYDSMTFTLWSANVTEESNLQQIRSAAASCQTTSSAQPQSTHQSSHEINRATIAGIVTGVVVALGAVGCIVYICFQRRKRTRIRRLQQSQGVQSDNKEAAPFINIRTKPVFVPPPQEMPATAHFSEPLEIDSVPKVEVP